MPERHSVYPVCAPVGPKSKVSEAPSTKSDKSINDRTRKQILLSTAVSFDGDSELGEADTKNGQGEFAKGRKTALWLESLRTKDLVRKKVHVKPSGRRKLNALLKELDQDGSGFLMADELAKGHEIAKRIRMDEKVWQEVYMFAVERCQQDEDGLLDIDEFLNIWVFDAPGFVTKHSKILKILATLGYFGLAPAIYIPFNVIEETGETWTIADALYFAAVTVTTVGYGDLHPENANMKLFTIFYIIFGLSIVAQVVSDCASEIVARYEARMQQFNRKMVEGMSATAGAAVAAAKVAKNITEDATNAVGNVKDAMTKELQGATKPLGDKLVPNAVSDGVDAVKNEMKEAVGKVTEGIDKVGDVIEGTLGLAMEEVGNQVDKDVIAKLWMSLLMFSLPYRPWINFLQV